MLNRQQKQDEAFVCEIERAAPVAKPIAASVPPPASKGTPLKDSALTVEDVQAIMRNVHKSMMPVFKALEEWAREGFAKRDARIAALEAAQSTVKYRGVYQPAESYFKGNFVTYDGSLWACIADTPGKPGTGGWQLAAKRGADGKDAREHT